MIEQRPIFFAACDRCHTTFRASDSTKVLFENKSVLKRTLIEDPKNRNYHYYGLFLNEGTKNKLMSMLTDNIDSNIALGVADKILLDHCTLMHVSQHENWLQSMLEHDLGKTFHITLTAVGISNKAIAFKVQRSGIVTPCKNKVPHITIATLNNGKPIDSNNITNWKDFPPITIITTLHKV